MRNHETPPVLAGVTGSAAGLAAVRLAAREAVARDLELRVVHAFTWSGLNSRGLNSRELDSRELDAREADPHEARRSASRVVDEAVATAQRSTPGVRVAGVLLDGPPDQVLIRLSRHAELLVVGDDDVNAIPRLPASSVLVQAAGRSWCPVLVARGPRPAAGPVLAAVDGSPAARQALLLAAEEATRLDRPLEILHVIADPDDAALEEDGLRILHEAAEAVPGVERKLVTLLTGDPAATLVRASARARRLIMGAHGDGGLRPLGSVARHVLHRGACPSIFFHGTMPRENAGPLPAEHPGHALAH